MKTRDLIELVFLGILWGTSFLFVRVAAPEFGVTALIEVRVVVAALALLPVVFARRCIPEILRNWRPIAIMGVLHYAIPFCLFAYSMLTLTGGFASIINASSPIFAGAIAWAWLGERLDGSRTAGLFIGVAGVFLLVSDRLSLSAGTDFLAVGASIMASFCYGLAAVMAKKKLAGISPIAVSSGSMLAASIVLLPLAIWTWPAVAPTSNGWLMAILLGVACTAVAFVLYFRLISKVGPSRAISVTFLIPFFAVLLGAMLIGEPITPGMIFGGAVVVLGTALATGTLDIAAVVRRLQGVSDTAF